MSMEDNDNCRKYKNGDKYMVMIMMTMTLHRVMTGIIGGGFDLCGPRFIWHVGTPPSFTAGMQGCAMCTSFHGVLYGCTLCTCMQFVKVYSIHYTSIHYTLYSAREFLCNVRCALFLCKDVSGRMSRITKWSSPDLVAPLFQFSHQSHHHHRNHYVKAYSAAWSC